MVGTFSCTLPGDQVSLHLSTAGDIEGSPSYNYSWVTVSTPVYCTGPRSGINHINQNDADAINRDDSIFRGDAPDDQNQCVFTRGHRIMLNCRVTDSGEVQPDAEVLPITDIGPEDVSAATSNIPFAGTSGSTLVSGQSGGGGPGSSQHRGTSEDSGQDEAWDTVQDYEVVLESIPEHSEVSI